MSLFTWILTQIFTFGKAKHRNVIINKNINLYIATDIAYRLWWGKKPATLTLLLR